MEFELKYTPAQEEFRNHVRAWLAENVPDGINIRPDTVDDSRALYLRRRAFGKKLGAKGWLYPSGDKAYGGGGLDFDQIIVLEEETARLGIGLRHITTAAARWAAPVSAYEAPRNRSSASCRPSTRVRSAVGNC